MNNTAPFYDILIAGAGPAGAMAALSARQAAPELSVGLVDDFTHIKPRIGEALLTGTIMTLDDAGLADALAEEGFHLKIGAAYVWGKTREPWYVEYPKSGAPYPSAFTHENGRYAIHVDRPKFDAFLRRHAALSGAEAIQGRVTGVSFGETGRALHAELNDGRKIRFRHFIDATGQAALVGNAAGMRRGAGARRVARYGYTDAVCWESAHKNGFDIHRTNIVSSENGWLWFIHLGQAGSGRTSIGAVCPPEVARTLTPSNIADAFPDMKKFGLAEGLRDCRDGEGKPVERLIAHSDYSFVCDSLDGPNWALAGDAAMFIDPILSQGVTLAVHYGRLRGRAAAAAILGSETAQAEVTLHYRREGAVLRQVVDEWYGNNRSVPAWKDIARSVAENKGQYGGADDAFRYVTNLENIRNEYDPFPSGIRSHIHEKLGVARNSI